jgi:hypothetical protein
MTIGVFALTLFWVAVVAAAAYWFWGNVRDGYAGKTAAPTHVCGNCRSVIRPVRKRPGTGGVELLLWLFFIIPGLIYSVWRSGAAYKVCPACGANNPVPLDTPAGKRLTTT